MKIRTDHVTNSSSSSFVIAYKDMPDIDTDTIEKYPFLKMYPKMIEIVLEGGSGYETTPAELFTNKEEYDEYFIDLYGCSWHKCIHDIIDCDEYLREMYYEVISYLEQGYIIAQKEVGYGDSVGYIINKLAEGNKNFVVLGGNGNESKN